MIKFIIRLFCRKKCEHEYITIKGKASCWGGKCKKCGKIDFRFAATPFGFLVSEMEMMKFKSECYKLLEEIK